jgi:hypothetical protein
LQPRFEEVRTGRLLNKQTARNETKKHGEGKEKGRIEKTKRNKKQERKKEPLRHMMTENTWLGLNKYLGFRIRRRRGSKPVRTKDTPLRSR